MLNRANIRARAESVVEELSLKTLYYYYYYYYY